MAPTVSNARAKKSVRQSANQYTQGEGEEEGRGAISRAVRPRVASWPSSKCRCTARGAPIIFFFSIDVTALLFSFRLTFRRGGPLVVDEKKCSPRTRLIGTSTRAATTDVCYSAYNASRALGSQRAKGDRKRVPYRRRTVGRGRGRREGGKEGVPLE